MGPLSWSIILLLIAIALVLVEVFIPSAGLLSVLAGMALLGAIVVAFSYDMVWGTTVLAMAAFGVPVLVAAVIRWWPHSPLGRLILIRRPAPELDEAQIDFENRLKELVGKVGFAKSKMLPSGAVVIDGRTYDAISKGMPIDAGQVIRVMEARTRRIVVRPVDDVELPLVEQSTAEQAASGQGDDLLSQPIDTVGLDPFEDPLG